MRLHVFTSGAQPDCWAVTRDRRGLALPAYLKPWRTAGVIDSSSVALEAPGVQMSNVLTLIASAGFYLGWGTVKLGLMG